MNGTILTLVNRSSILLPALLLLVSVFSSSAAEAQTCKDSILAGTPETNFTLHSNGTATHNTTGLTWMRCALGQSWNGKSCTGSAEQHSWQSALAAANRHAFAGHTDWRLPNKNELESILEERCYSPAINLNVFPATPSSYFWSSSPYTGISFGAWSVDFAFGTVNATVKTGKIHVRLVRGGE
jgi:hypothetical protein